MIVDDEPYCLLGLTSMLESTSFSISRLDTANGGKEALELVRKAYMLGFEYKLILMDLSMPGMDGFTTTKAIREMLEGEFLASPPRIVGLSGHVGDDYQNQARRAGMATLEPKPMYLRKLVNIFESVGEKIAID